MPAPISSPARWARTGRLVVLGVLAAVSMLVAGCANFTDVAAGQNWHPQHRLPPEQAPQPQIPGAPKPEPGTSGAQSSPPSAARPPDGCKDFNPAVIATCLDPVSAVAALPSQNGRPAGLAAERASGKIMRVVKGQQPALVRKLDVVATGDGGLTGLALSPSYSEDQLVFAYITTPTDNRVVRFTDGDTPKPVLTGIPKGSTGNRGALAVDKTGALLVATGDAGNPTNASNPDSLAGKVLRIDVTGKPAKGDPSPDSPVIASGLTDPGGMCTSKDSSRVWITDRKADAGVLYRLDVGKHDGKPLNSPAWRWPDKPGVAGCAAFDRTIMVATSTAGNVQQLPLNPDGSFGGKPQVTMSGENGFGRLSGVDRSDKYALVGTVNKDGGHPVSSDDRVVVITPQGGGGGGKD